MKKTLFALMATLISTNIMAEWIRVGGSGDNDSDIYVDLATVRRADKKAKIWTLESFKTLQGKTTDGRYLSNKIHWEFDCQEDYMKMPIFSTFSKKMGGGRVIYSENSPNDKWHAVPPESVGELVREVACDETSGKTKWTAITRAKATGLTEYIGLETILRSGDYVTLWELSDYKSDNASQFNNFSMKSQREYDCKETRTRRLTSMFFYGNMGAGKAQNSKNDISEWKPIKPGSSGETYWKIACDKQVGS